MIHIIVFSILSVIFLIIGIILLILGNKKVIIFKAKIKKMKCIKGNAKISSDSNNSYYRYGVYYSTTFHHGNKNTNVQMYDRCSLKLEYNQKDLHPELKAKKVYIDLKDVTTGPYFKNEVIELEAELPHKDNIRVCCKNYSGFIFSGIIFIVLSVSFMIPIFFYKDDK